MLAQLRVQVTQDPQEAAFRVWAQVMIVKAPPKYDEQFAKRLEWIAVLVVEKYALT